MARRFGEREIEPVKKRTGLFGKKMFGFMAIYLVIWMGTTMLFPKEWELQAEPEALYSAEVQEQVMRKIGSEFPLYIQGFTFDLGDGEGFREAMSFGAVPYEARGENEYRAWYISYDAAQKNPYQLHRINKSFKMDNPPPYSMETGYLAMKQVSGHLRALYDAVPESLRTGASSLFLSTASASAYPGGAGEPAPLSAQAVTITISDGLTVRPGVHRQSGNEKTLYLYSSFPTPPKEGETTPGTRTELAAVIELVQSGTL